MTRKTLAARISPLQDLRDCIRTLAELGLGGVVIEAIGPLSPLELSRTGRREIRALLASGGISLDGVGLPTRRSISEIEMWDDRQTRMRTAMEMAYELGATRVCLSPGAVPVDERRRGLFLDHLGQLADAAERHGVILVCESGLEPFASMMEAILQTCRPNLAISLDPGRLTVSGQDIVVAAESAHAHLGLVYATDPEFLGLGYGSRGQSIDWDRFRDNLEEIGYRGRLTIWPEATLDLGRVVAEMGRRLKVTPKL